MTPGTGDGPLQGASGLGFFWRRLGRHGSAYLVGEAGAKGVVYLLLIAVAPLLGVRDFGYFNLFLSVLGLLTAVVGLGLPDAVTPFYFQSRDLRGVLGAVWLLVAAAGVVAVAAAWVLRHPLAELLGTPELLLPAAAAAAPLAALRLAWLSLLRARRESLLFAAARLAEPLLFAAAIGGGMAVGLSPAQGWLTAAWLATLGVVALWATGSVLWRPGPPAGAAATLEPVRPLLAFSLPLIFHALAMTGLASFDQVVVQQLLGAEATGLYAFAYRFGMAMSLVAFGLSAAWSPIVLESFARSDPRRDLPGLATLGTDLATGAAVVLAFGLPPVAAWIGGDAYRGALHLLPVVVYGYLWVALYGLAVVFLVQDRRTRGVAAASGGAFLANALLNYLLVPRFGIAAAAGTTVLSYVLLLGLVLLQLGERRPILPWPRLLLRPLLAAVPVAVAVLVFS